MRVSPGTVGTGVAEPGLAGRWAAIWASVGAFVLLLAFLWPMVGTWEGDPSTQRVWWFWDDFWGGRPWNLPWDFVVNRYIAPVLGILTLVAVASTRDRLRAIVLVALPTTALLLADSLVFYDLGNALLALGVVALLAGNRVRRSHPTSRVAMTLAGVGALSALVPAVVRVGRDEKPSIGWLLDTEMWSREWSWQFVLLVELAVAVVGLLSFVPGDRRSIRRAITLLGWAVILAGPVMSVRSSVLLDSDRVSETISMAVRLPGPLVGALTVLGVGLAALVDGFLREHPSGAVAAAGRTA